MNTRIPIVHASGRLPAITGQPAPAPRKIYDLALRGAFPCEFRNGRWTMLEADIPALAEALGLRARDSAEA